MSQSYRAGMYAPHRPFGLTQCSYPANDPFGPLVCLVTLSPVYLMVALVVLLASRRDLATGALLLGQLLNEGLNYLLKNWLRQPRPPSMAPSFGGPVYGMPSNHAQFVGFLAAYLCLWAAVCWRAPRLLRRLATLAALLAAGAVAATRVYLRLHTPAQVGVGLAVGAASAGAWFVLVQAILRPRFHALAHSALGRALQLRDCTFVDDVLTLEFTATIEAAAAARTRAARRAAAREGGATPPRSAGGDDDELFESFEGGRASDSRGAGAEVGGDSEGRDGSGGAYRRKAR